MSDDDKLTNIRNVLGFLLTGFGAVLTFLGIRSSEVTTILRNNSPQASLIAFILLLGVLAAVCAIATDNKKKINRASAVAIVFILLGLGALTIFFIPIGLDLFTVSGTISLVIGCICVAAGALTLIPRSFFTESGIGVVDFLIITSVLLIAIAAYGAMRLESKSQLSFSSQVGATFSVNGSVATVSVDITATKLAQNDWVFVDVYAVPNGTKLAEMCAHYVVPANVPNYRSATAAPLVQYYINHCTTDPCVYFIAGNYNGWPNVCDVLLNGSIVPNATGDVDETLSVPFSISMYEDVDVRAEVCQASNGVCEGSVNRQNSRLDWVISQPH